MYNYACLEVLDLKVNPCTTGQTLNIQHKNWTSQIIDGQSNYSLSQGMSQGITEAVDCSFLELDCQKFVFKTWKIKM